MLQRAIPSLAALWALFATPVLAQSDLAFTWGFLNGENEVSRCDSIEIQIVSARDSSPPYYMFQYPINSTLSPTILTYGRGETNEMTLAPYPAGTDVVFAMVDAFGASGGVTSVYTIQSGDDDCADVPDTGLDVSLNTTEVGTCGTVGVTIDGGEPPYTVTVFPQDSVARTWNITMPSSDSYLSFVNSLGANLMLAFGVRDSNSLWAPVAGPLWTFGTDQECDQDSTTAASPPAEDDAGDSSGPNNDNPNGDNDDASGGGGGGGGGGGAGVIAGPIIGGLAAVAAVTLGLAWYLGWCCFPGKRQRKSPAYHSAAYEGPPSPGGSPLPTGASGSGLVPFSVQSSAGAPSTGYAAGMGGPGGHHSRTSIDTSNRPMSQLTPGVSPGGFRLHNPDEEQGQEALYPPSPAFVSTGHHTARSSWDSANTPSSSQPYYQSLQSHASSGQGPRSSLPMAPGSEAGGSEGPPMSVSEKAAAFMSDAGPRPGSSSRPLRQHTDAGPAPQAQQQPEEEELPPAYMGFREENVAGPSR